MCIMWFSVTGKSNLQSCMSFPVSLWSKVFFKSCFYFFKSCYVQEKMKEAENRFVCLFHRYSTTLHQIITGWKTWCHEVKKCNHWQITVVCEEEAILACAVKGKQSPSVRSHQETLLLIISWWLINSIFCPALFVVYISGFLNSITALYRTI